MYKEVINLEDNSKPDEEKPKEPVDEAKVEPVDKSQPEVEVKETEESSDKAVDEVVEEKTEESADEDVESEEAVEKDKPEDIIETEEVAKKEEKTAESKPKKEDKKKKDDKDDDFKYIVRIANTDIDGDKKLVHGLTSIKGIGMHMGSVIANDTGIDKNKKMGDMTDAEIEKIRISIDNIINSAPGWMLNHRKDYESGKDIHLIGPEIDMQLRDEINIMKKIRSYRGIRHERGLPVRGQRTRANNRKGLALGVSKKREVGSK